MFNRVVITSGPTIEPIDPVRFISNRSSGKSGFFIAQEAKKRGIKEIIFITGPTHHLPQGVRLHQVETTLDMRSKILKYFGNADVVIMAAAICDFKSAKYYSEKIKSKADYLSLKLIKNPDILFELGQKKSHQILVGFAAETENIFENATQKLNDKKTDLLVLNEISDDNPAFNSDFNQVYFLDHRGIKKLAKMKKAQMAVHLWDEIYDIAREKISKRR